MRCWTFAFGAAFALSLRDALYAKGLLEFLFHAAMCAGFVYGAHIEARDAKAQERGKGP